MLRRSILFVVVGAIAGGCSRDAPPTGPDLELAAQPRSPAGVNLLVSATSGGSAGLIDDALRRLVPALGSTGDALRSPLLRLQKRPSDATALADLRRALDAAQRSAPAAYQADLSALRLHAETIATK